MGMWGGSMHDFSVGMSVQRDPVQSEHAEILAVMSFGMQGASHHLGR